MKKTIAILLVAVLAAGSVFAGLSGEASVKAGVDLDKKEWGFLENGTNVKFDLSLGKEDVENVAEGEVYASIKASFEAKLANNPYKGTSSIDVINSDGALLKGGEAYGYDYPVRVRASISEAKVFGSNWYVSILGVPGAPDFAKSAIDTETDKKAGSLDDWGFPIKDDTSKAVSYKVAYDKAPGVEAGYADYVVGAGLKASNGGKAYTAYVQTPEYTFDAVNAQFAAVASKAANTGVNNFGASAKASYATDVLSTSVAADLGLAVAKESKFAMDLAANFKYDFVTVDAYLNTAKATKAEDPTETPFGKEALPVLLSAKVATDLNAFDVPVKVELTGKDLLATTDLGVKATVTAVENLELTVSGGYVLNTVGRNAEALWVAKVADIKPFAGQWNAKVGAKYTASFATISGEVSLKNWGLNDAVNTYMSTTNPETATAATELLTAYVKEYELTNSNLEKQLDTLAKRLVLGAKVSVENTTLIPGATLKLAWEGKDLVNKVAKQVTKGTVAATCTIKF